MTRGVLSFVQGPAESAAGAGRLVCKRVTPMAGRDSGVGACRCPHSFRGPARPNCARSSAPLIQGDCGVSAGIGEWARRLSLPLCKMGAAVPHAPLTTNCQPRLGHLEEVKKDA